ncbi:hypothetical protein C8T65DRAFT_716723 [Cerioporus squamosus]|nr:hypothetical protein C8T65DRAFT_716723 [Cerioporus squamosus]
MPPPASSASSILKGAWRPTKIMNMRDLSRDDDFLSHLLVEKLGTGGFPLVVHKMDPSRRLPKSDPEELMQIVRRLVAFKGPSQTAIRHAVDDLLSCVHTPTILPSSPRSPAYTPPSINAVRYYLRSYTQKQINAFATHASRYFELYLPSGSIEIAHTSRYSHHTGKSELCILATRPLVPGTVISELKGSMADLTEEEDKELKGTDVGQAQGVGIRRDFSVIHSKQLKKNHLFLGPARFVNHDCDHNVELFREGRYITFRVIKHIGVGEEVTAHYGDGYFGRNNRHCLCATCEVNKRGGYAPQNDEDISDSGSSPDSSSSDSESDWTTDHEDDAARAEINVNERRTRRGVYAVLPDEEQDAADGSDADVDAEPDATSELTSAPRSSSTGPAIAGPSKHNTGLLTPETETLPAESRPASVASTPRKATPIPAFIIATRAQKARAASEAASVSASIVEKGKGKERATSSSRSASAVRQLETPPLTSDTGSVADGPSLRSSVRLRARGDAASSASRVSTPMPDRKGKAPASAHDSTADTVDLKGKGKDDPELEGRSLRRRPVIPAPVDALMAVAKKPQDGPRGVDGKLLPTCMTCYSVLPVISVEDKVVWNGLPEKTGKRGRPRKQVNQECPRCMRHYAIYAARWPERMPSVGTPAFVPTPRENRSITPAYLSHKTLSAVNQKLAHAASGSRSASAARKPPANKRARTADPEEAPAPKRQKVESASASASRLSKAKVGMSNEARKLLGVRERRSGRARVPSLKMRESEPPSKGRGASSAAGPSNAPVSTASTLSAASSSHSDVPLPTPQTPARERHLRSGGGDVPPPPTTPIVVKSEPGSKLPTPKSLAVASQPRESNGRFGKKATTNGRYMRKNFHFTAGGRRVPRGRKQQKPHSRNQEGGDGGFKRDPDAPAESDDGPSTSSHKRSLEEDEDEEDRKRRRMGDETSEPRIKIEGEEGDLSVLSSERDCEEQDDDGGSQDEAEPLHFRRPFLGVAKRSGGLFGRPNPLTFARRKWINTSSMPPEDPQEARDGPANANVYSLRRSPTTDDDTDGPVTPEDDVDPPADVVEDDKYPAEEDDRDAESDDSASERAFVRPKLMGRPAFGGLFRPNPLNMARLRWAPPRPPSADEEDAEDYATEIAHTHSKTPSRTSLASFGDLFEPEADEAPLDADVTAHGSIDPGASSEEESFRPSMLSVFKPGRRSSSASSALVDLTDDSEQSVERLVSVSDPLPSSSSSESRPASAGSLTLPVLPPSPQKSPGMAWKQTVLLPRNVPPYMHSLHTTVAVAPDISPAPTKLLRAGWDSGSSDSTD